MCSWLETGMWAILLGRCAGGPQNSAIMYLRWRRGWDLNPRSRKGIPLFESGAFVHSATSPHIPEYSTPRCFSRYAQLQSCEALSPSRDMGKVLVTS